jgi:acyl-coenzyme A thioesterase PaaI-like protein
MTDREGRDAKIEAVLANMMGRPCIRDLFGIELVSWEAGAVTLDLVQRPALGHAPGWFQGAVTTAIAEYAASFSGVTLAPDKDSMTLQQNIHFTGPARGNRLIAEGRVLRAGRTISTTAAEVFVEWDGERFPCATLTMTLSHKDRD